MFIGNQKGQALVIVLLMTAAVFLVGGAALIMGTTARKTAVYEVNQKKAYYIAEAGVERALAELKADSSWRDGRGTELSGGYGGGFIESVYCETATVQEDIGTLVEITSTGTFGASPYLSKRTLNVDVLIVSLDDLLKGLSVLPDDPVGVTFTGNFEIEPAGSKTPQVILNGDLTIKGSCSVEGDVFASGSIDVNKDSAVTGDKNSSYPAIPPFPSIDEDELKDRAMDQGRYYSGGSKFGNPDDKGKKDDERIIDISNLSSNALYFVDGDIEISGTYSGGPAIIAATGDIQITDDLRKADGSEYLIVLISLKKDGSVYVQGGSTVIDALIISKGCLNVKGNTTLNGSVVTKQLVKPDDKLNGSVKIVSDPDLARQSLPSHIDVFSPPTIKLKSWVEG